MNDKKNTITMMSEEFENAQTGEKVEGVTVVVDGMLKMILDIIKTQKPEYKNNVEILHDALVKGLEEIKNGL